MNDLQRLIRDIAKILNAGNERLYNIAVIPALLTEVISRLSGDKEVMEISKKLYKISRNVRAVEEFLSYYAKSGDIDKAIDRALFKTKKRYVGGKNDRKGKRGSK